MRRDPDFFGYWENLGFFENLQLVIPRNFYILFDIARLIFTNEISCEAINAMEEILKEDSIYLPDRKESINVNRLERIAPLSDRMEIDSYKTLYDLKKALSRELAWEPDVFDVKLFTKTLLVQKHYESEADRFKPVSTSPDRKGKDGRKFEQKFYILLDRSKSMDTKLRSFYAKCMVAEFMRRKLNSRARLYFRAFDTKPGPLVKIEKREDFPRIIEEVLLTVTGGTSTNIREAVLQAVADIKFDKETTKAEILVVTDGISRIDKNELKLKLGDIKLNVLKIGGDIPVPDFYEVEEAMKRDGTRIDPTVLSIRRIQEDVARMREDESSASMPIHARKILRDIIDKSEKMFKDLKDISKKYIEIGDLKSDTLFKVTDEQIKCVMESASALAAVDISDMPPPDRKKVYRKAQLLQQYIEMLIQNEKSPDARLVSANENLLAVKRKLLSDPHILFTFMKSGELKDDKSMNKLAKKEVKSLLKQMKMDERRLSIKEMRQANLFFTADVGRGSMGQFIILLLIKLWETLKRPFKPGVKVQ
jgi:hypothetical protein